VSEPRAINELAPNGLVSMDMQDYMDLVADVRRLEWLVENGARVCKLFDRWTVWFNEGSCATVCVRFDSWRDAIDEAMRGEG